MAKMEQILHWLTNIEHQQTHRKTEEETPINSSFVYIPVHSYTTFHDLFRESLVLSKEPLLKEDRVSGLRR